jgi:hypothetical protein
MAENDQQQQNVINIELFTEFLRAQAEAQAHVAVPAQQLEVVRCPTYDGTSDVEDFISLYLYLVELYGWAAPIQLAKLKTSLTGKAAECSRPNNVEEIIQALRARFGITPAEAKRNLLGMRTGQTERLRELADRIRKLTDLAYPGVNNDIRETLTLDQFKRCVSTDLSIFMVSRPPVDLNDAVRI